MNLNLNFRKKLKKIEVFKILEKKLKLLSYGYDRDKKSIISLTEGVITHNLE